jgi:hypothetical protein
MRYAGFFAIASLAVACGPDPNAHVPVEVTSVTSGGTHGGSGGAGGVGAGGTRVSSGGNGGSSVIPPASGGTAGSSPFESGGAAGRNPSSGGAAGSPSGGTTTPSSGGAAGRSPFNTGGTAGRSTGPDSGSGGSTTSGRGGAGAGGITSIPSQGGSGGTITPTSGALASYTFPAGTEPCTPAKDISGGQSGNFGTTGAFCFRTADDFTDYGCSSADGRTVKINGTEITTCGGKPPAKLGSFYYFDFGPGKYEYTGINWYCSTQSCLGPHPVPSCGHYPPWQSGETVPPCADSATTDDAGMSGAAIDSGG